MRSHYDRPTVLLVDNDADVIEAFGEYLEMSGVAVMTTTEAATGINLAREILPDLIVLDVTMPVLDGYQVVQALQERPETRRIPVVFFTGLPADHVRRAPSVVASLQKPVRPDDLLGIIKMLGSRV